MSDFTIAAIAVFTGWCFGFMTYALIETARILKEIKARNR